MGLSVTDANKVASDILLALAQSGTLKTAVHAANQTTQFAVQSGERDAAYLASIYQNLVSGLQK